MSTDIDDDDFETDDDDNVFEEPEKPAVTTKTLSADDIRRARQLEVRRKLEERQLFHSLKNEYDFDDDIFDKLSKS